MGKGVKIAGWLLGVCSFIAARGEEIAPHDARVWATGVVVDASGAGVGQAELVLMRDGAEIAEAKASAAGRFEVEVPEGTVAGAGACELVVSAPGFGSSSVPVRCGVDGRVLTVQLAVAQQVEQVEVEGDAAGADVEPNETQIGSVLNRQQVASVPLNGRSFTDLLALTPGVVPQSSAQPNAVVMSGVASTPPSGDLDIGALSVSGQRETQNAFRVNDSNVQEDVNMGVAVVPTLDSIADLEVLTGSYDAKLGNQSGGQISVTTRSGGAKVHGSLYDYFRNTALDARNYFSLSRAPFHQEQFGGTVGGPVPWTKKVFFFGDYQGTRQTQGVDTGLIAVPTAAERAGDLANEASSLTGSVSGPSFAQMLSSKLGYAVTQGEPYYTESCTAANGQCVFPGGVIPQSVFSAPAQQLLQYIPQPNAGSGTFSTSTYAQTVRDDKGSLRLDTQTRWGALTGYYFLDDYTLLNPYPTGQGGATVPGFNAQNNGRAQLAAVNLQTVMGSTGTNLAHVSYMRNAAAAGEPRGGVGVSLASQGFVTGAGTSGIVPLLPGIEGVENVVFNSYTMGVDVTSLFQAENTFEVADDASRTIGRHVVSVGVDFHADEINTHPTVYDNGSFSFTGSETGSDFADFLLGIDSSYTQGQGQKFYNRNHYVGVYGQDSWQLTPQLTLNYGLRWDVLPPWSEKFNQMLTLDPTEQSAVFPNAPQGILFPGDPGVPKTIAPTRYGNVAPRAAVSWAPKSAQPLLARVLGAPGATLVKAGYGVYYSAFEGLSAGIASGDPPYGFTDTTPAPTLFAEPFVTAATGVSIGQRFPLQPVAYGATAAHPNTSVDWANFEPQTGIVAFAKNNVTPYAENYSLSVEREVGAHTVVSVGYVGTQAHHLLVIQQVNPGDPAACLALSSPASVAAGSATCGPFGESSTYTTAAGQVVQGTRSVFGPAFGSVNLQKTIANSHDNALEVSVKHSTRTLFLQLGYTWSKSMDQSSSLAEAVYPDVAEFSGFGRTGAGMSRALSAFDLTHNFVAVYRYTLPVGKLMKGPRRLVEGWDVSGLTRFSTGFPVTLFNNNDTSLLGTQPNGINNNGVDEPEVAVGDLQVNHRPGPGGYAFNTSLFSLPQLGTLGNARRRFFYGPGADNTDLAIEKTTELSRGMSLEIRAEAFNVFNHGQFFGPAAVSGNISSTNFGQVQSSSPPRLMQLAARLRF